jgi:poly(3-hydroxybutyrate) depolymerase
MYQSTQGCSPNCPHAQHISITVGGMQRQYILNVPTNYDNTHAYKLILAYHWLNGDDDQVYSNDYYHLLPLSDDSTIFVALNGEFDPSAGFGNTPLWENKNDEDVLFSDAVVAQIESNFCVDKSRIFATGWSYGASMSYEMACERPRGSTTNGVAGYVRAVAVYSAAQLSGSCKPTTPVPYYASHGTGDATLPYSGGVQLCENMATVDGCTWVTPTDVTSGDHVCTNFTGCMAGYPVEFCSFNGPHTPDPTDPGQQMSWEYQNAWKFISQF